MNPPIQQNGIFEPHYTKNGIFETPIYKKMAYSRYPFTKKMHFREDGDNIL